ncbi:MAG TPA: hypothetical protein VFN61_11435 [Acidimicrobiales bacterium]|nr:hypothetical protein [Acidimicrobiales bacterium]
MPEHRPSKSRAEVQLAELADAEAAQLKQRHKDREAAIRRYENARRALTDAETAMASARQEQASAIGSLLDSGLDTNAVAGVLGVDARRIREARSVTKRAKSDAGVGVGNTSEAHD